MSHCMTSAETRSSRTAPDSSPWRPSVTSTTVCLLWFSMQRPSGGPPGAPWHPRKSVVRSRRLLRRKRFQEARVESTRRDVPRFRNRITSDGANLPTRGRTGDSNSHLIRHSKSGSRASESAMSRSRLSQRSRSPPCMLSKSRRTRSSSPLLTASSSGDQPLDERKRGSALASNRCATTASYSPALGFNSTANISGVAWWLSAWFTSPRAPSSALRRGRSASQTALCSG
mmetsp:Transcript_27112/g.80813  ORF Transcript_27112/g.80813 Transcript_27112/m.80813 type:complete len:229 (-) Transcript_27112:294-980(-)